MARGGLSRVPAACTAAILSIGAAGMIAQTTLLRELLSQYAGSELYVGLIIGNWIAAESLGVFAAGRFMKDPCRAFSRFIHLTILFSLLFPAMLFLSRSYRFVFSLPLHEGASFWQILLSSIAIIFPLAIIHGAQFFLVTLIHAGFTGRGADSPGRVYGVDTVGTVIGGAAVAFILTPYLRPFQISALLLLMNTAICFFLWAIIPALMKHTGRAILFIPLLAALIMFYPGAYFLEDGSLRLQWHDESLVSVRSTPYQNIAVIRNGEQFTFFTDGVPVLSLPDPDTARIEESAHIPLLAHPSPRRVLLLGGGAGGLITEVLKHRTVERIDYPERDPALLATIGEYAPEAIHKELNDPRVHIHHKDGRAFLRDTGIRYDVVLLGEALPQNLQENRYFTAEFFAALKRVLAPDGIVSLGSAGSLSYYGDDLKEVTRSLTATLGNAFPHLLIVPGERNLFVASATLSVEKLSATDLSGRLASRGVNTLLINAQHLEWLTSGTQLQWFKNSVGDGGVINSDYSPYLLTRHLSYMTTLFNPEMKSALEMMRRVNPVPLAAAILCVAAGIAAFSGRRSRVSVIWMIATTGFSAMLLELSFFFIFQLFQGVMLQSIGLLIAVFMTGLWAGSRITSSTPHSEASDVRWLFSGEILLMVISGLLWMISSGMLLSTGASHAAVYLTLLPLLLLTGFAAGAQFPPATRLTAQNGAPGTSLVYGFDLLGGWLGGVVGGALLLPLLGFSATAMILIMLKGGSFFCLYLHGKKVKI